MLNGPLKDLSSALIVARQYRTGVSPLELMSITWEAYQNKAELKASEEAEYGLGTETSFQYFDSPFLNRFCNIKFTDTSLAMEGQVAEQIGESRMHDEMWKVWREHFLTSFPAPVIKLLRLPINKSAVASDSFGDELVVLATGNVEQLGGDFTGDLIGVDLATFGVWFLLVVFVFGIGLFILLDALALPPSLVKAASAPAGNPPEAAGWSSPIPPKLSILGLLSISIFFAILTPESTETWATYFTRYWLQAVILYAIAFKLTRFRL
jgi:hypothetical protein